jgi:hypothetical protein
VAAEKALNQVDFAVDREAGAVRSIEDVYSGSAQAKGAVGDRARQWELYRTALRGQIEGYAKVRAATLGVTVPAAGKPRDVKPAPPAIVPALAPAVKGREFSLGAFQPYSEFVKANPEALKKLGLTPSLGNGILNYVNGRRSAAAIRNAVAAETGQDLTIESVTGYLEILKKVGWVSY